MGRKTNVWIIQATNMQTFSRENFDNCNEKETIREKLNLF